MEKKINKKQIEIKEAKEERARRKVIYDSTIIIVEGHRKTVHELEVKADTAFKDYTDADKNVEKLMQELQEMTEETK